MIQHLWSLDATFADWFVFWFYFQPKCLCKDLWEDGSETRFKRAVEVSLEQNREADCASTSDGPNGKCPRSHTVYGSVTNTVLYEGVKTWVSNVPAHHRTVASTSFTGFVHTHFNALVYYAYLETALFQWMCQIYISETFHLRFKHFCANLICKYRSSIQTG